MCEAKKEKRIKAYCKKIKCRIHIFLLYNAREIG